MPPVDLETLVSVCGGSTVDRKIACEPIADVSEDFPPESFWLSKDAEFDWFDRNAFLERKESTRGNANSTNLNHSNSNSQRFSLSLKSKAAIIGLPKTQKTNFVDKRRHCKPPSIRLFPPKRSESVGKATAQMTEPSSPKVSCMGRVRSKRGIRRNPTKPEKQAVKPAGRPRSAGFCASFMSLFRFGHQSRDKSVCSRDDPSVKSSSRKRTTRKERQVPVCDDPAGEPPNLGGMTRFVSGRRSESWAADEVDVAGRDSVDSERSVMFARSGSSRRI